MNIRELRKGDVLDRLVVDKIFGQMVWEDADESLIFNDVPVGFVIPNHVFYTMMSRELAKAKPDYLKMDSHRIKNYSGDVGLALLVIPRMMELGYQTKLKTVGGRHICTFGVHTFESDSLAEAICISALIALKEDGK